MDSLHVRAYDVDRNLGYMIQQITGDSTQEILTYFYRVAQFAILEMAKKTKSSYMDKSIILFYKDTPITFSIKMFIGGLQTAEPTASITVRFPKCPEQYDIEELKTSMVESGLELTDSHNLPAFKMPELRTPKCLRVVKGAQIEQRSKTTT